MKHTISRNRKWQALLAVVALSAPYAASEPVDAATVPTPPTPAGISAGPTTGNVTVTWTTPSTTGGSPITSFKIEMSEDGGPFGPPLSQGITKRKATVACAAVTDCTARVYATNAIGDSVTTAPVTTTWAIPSVSNATSAAFTGVGQVLVKWALPKNNGGKVVTQFVYQEADDNLGAWGLATVVPGSGPTTKVATLPCSSPNVNGGCAYRVMAENSEGTALPGVSKYAAYSVPGAPILIRVAAGHSPGTAEVDWTGPGKTGGLALTHFTYEVSTDGGPYVLGPNLPLTPTEGQLPCTGSVNCSYRLRAHNAKGQSALSNTLSTSFQAPTPPAGLAVNVTAASAAAGTSDVTATWNVPNNVGGLAITDFEVQFCDGLCPNDDPAWNTAPITSVGLAQTFTTTCPAGEPSCTVRVRASNGFGTSGWTTVKSIAPSAAYNLVTVALPSAGDIQIDWDGPAESGTGFSHFEVWSCPTASGCGNNANWSDTGLDPVAQTAVHQCGPLTQCDYRVRAIDTTNHEGPFSNLATGTAPALATSPQNISAVTGTVIGEVVVDWDPPLNTGGYPVIGYTLERSTDGGGTWPTTFNLGPTPGPYNDGACGASVVCTYRVAAVTAVGQGTYSANASAEGANVPSAPPNLAAATGSTLGFVDVIWQTPLDNGGQPITAYELQRSFDGGGTWPDTFGLGVVLSYTDTTCGAGVECTYRVRAINLLGNGTFSNIDSAYGAQVPGPPTGLTATTPTPNGSFVTPNLGLVDVAWTAPGPVNGAPAVTGYEYRFQSRTLPGGGFGAFGAWTTTGTGLGTSFSPVCDASYTDLTDLECNYEVRALNPIGSGSESNQDADPALVDHVAPTVTLVNPTNASFTNDDTPAIDGTGGTAVGDATTVTVVIKTSPGGVTVQTIPGVPVIAGNWSTTAASLPQGQYTFQASQVDWVPNTGLSNINTVDIDGTPPVLTITAPTAGQNVDGNSTLVITSTTTDLVPPNGSVSVRVYTASSACSGANTLITENPAASPFNANYTPSPTENLTQSIQLTQTDAAGNTGTSACRPFASRNAVWVNKVTGSDANSGLTPALAKATIQAGITAAAGGRNRVLIGSDTAYTGTALGLASSGSTFGGFSVSGSTWTRPGIALVAGTVSANSTIFTSSTAEGAVADADTGVTLDGLKVISANASGAGNSSYSLRAVNGSTVTLNNVNLTSGNGVAGVNGTNGTSNAGNGSGGGTGQNGTGNGSGNTAGGSSGAGVGGRNGSVGGNGGGQGNNAGSAGTNGIVSGGGGGSGGAGGNANGNCNDSGAGQGGGRVTATTAGSSGASGSSGAATLTGSGVALWTVASGGLGGTGGNGHGGGGGGGGAGDGGQAAFPTCISDSGAGGGGGGGGGGGANGGTGASGGGGSFGLYAFNSTVTVTTATIIAGNGAAGGTGGNGFSGGTGGGGGNGGSCDTGQENGSGGGGGGGSGGGGGGGGGGGSAGPSIAVYENGTGSVSLTGATLTKGTVGGTGAGGSAGSGGGGGSAGIRGNSSQGENSNGNGCFAGQNGATGTTGASGSGGSAGSGGATFNLKSYIDGTSTP